MDASDTRSIPGGIIESEPVSPSTGCATLRALRSAARYGKDHAVPATYTSPDEYLAALPAPKRATLERLREQIKRIVPESLEVMSYGMPAFKVGGKVVVGFAANKNDFSLYPFSGSAGDVFGDELADRLVTKGSIHFTPDNPVPEDLLRRLIEWKLALNATGK